MDRSSKQNINNEIVALNDTLYQMGLIDILRLFHPKTEEYIFFSSTHGTFSRADHKGSLNNFKKNKVIPCKCSDHNAVKLEINHKEKLRKSTNTWSLNNVLLNNEWVNHETKEKKKIHGDK